MLNEQDKARVRALVVAGMPKAQIEWYCEHPKKAAGLLRDLLPEDRGACMVLATVAETRFARQLWKRRGRFAAVEASAMVTRFMRETLYAEDLSRWGLGTWAEVIGELPSFVRRGAATPPAPTPKPNPGPIPTPIPTPRIVTRLKAAPEPSRLAQPATGQRPAMVAIPAGAFRMGGPVSEKGRNANERQHQVTLSRFLLAATQVTQGQYAAVVGERPSHFKGSDDLPVETVSWHDAVAYCNALSKLEGLTPAYQDIKTGWFSKELKLITSADGYRLPTEAEWEYGCRAGTTTRFWSGNKESDLARVAWYDANSGGQTHPVGQKAANPWGLYDMHGNVWEWCHDWFGDYSAHAQTDPTGPKASGLRVHRGGSWHNPGTFLRAAGRNRYMPSDRGRSLGFRLSRSVP